MREDYATYLLAAAITAFPDTRKPPPDLRITELATDPMMLTASPDRPLASRDRIPLTQLREEPMVAPVAFRLENLALRHGDGPMQATRAEALMYVRTRHPVTPTTAN